MSDYDVKERRFEEDIAAYLCSASGGYMKGDPRKFDRASALDIETLIAFVSTTQPKAWERYVRIYGDRSRESFVSRFSQEVRQLGLLKVLRKGFSDRGINFKLVYWKPESSINETAAEQYAQNMLHCTRQLRYSPNSENSIDIVLFLNGIPVVSMELKCQFTGQDTENAIRQYKFDRAGKDTIFEFKNRVLVHFAVDLCNVYMTTRLMGANTYFLPFNQGSNGAGQVGGKGNPPNPSGYPTAYLWERVLCKDGLLDILHKYMHVQKETLEDRNGRKTVKETMIFPRYHQLDVVTSLIGDARVNGAGKNYLIQHSAGSGKSNSIAWLAYRLMSLHDDANEKIFRSVVVVTDRKVLDSQLQDTIYQFDHVDGVVQKINENSKQLLEALNVGVGIIVTTLQKFPVIYDKVKSADGRYAVIVDEAHSSQTGEAAKKLKEALADTEKVLAQEAAEEAEAEEKRQDGEDKLLEVLAAQGQQQNLSFFAFTATPKAKTLQMFGRKTAEGRYEPCHVYSMQQAIEEGFILDVLRNYTTYSTYYKIIKSIPDDPEMETTAGVKAVRRFESLHPHNITQKTAVIIDHFRRVTRFEIGGKAKAMLVTSSRLHAVRYLKEFRKQITAGGFKDLDVLVAFSGEVNDAGDKVSEEKLNKTKDGKTVKEGQLKAVFHTEDFNMLIVAEKYQTGFDEPYLQTMYVDKKLTGVKAVQTLSRLNRTMRGKNGTFVLDFVNTAEDMEKAFAPFYQSTVLSGGSDPNEIYALKNKLDAYHVYTETEIEGFAQIFFKLSPQDDGMGKLSGFFVLAQRRYLELAEEDRDAFKTELAKFIRHYSFITQICRMFDKAMHKFYAYARLLIKFLPKTGEPPIDIDGKIALEYYKLECVFDGSVGLGPAGPESDRLVNPENMRKAKKTDPLTKIIEMVNQRFGTEFTGMDKVLRQVEDDFVNDVKWVTYAQMGEGTFGDMFESGFKTKIAERCEQNEAFFAKVLGDEDFMHSLMTLMRGNLYRKLRANKTAIPDIVAESKRGYEWRT